MLYMVHAFAIMLILIHDRLGLKTCSMLPLPSALDWVPTRTIGSSLFCYLGHRWREMRLHILLKGTFVVYDFGFPIFVFESLPFATPAHPSVISI